MRKLNICLHVSLAIGLFLVVTSCFQDNKVDDSKTKDSIQPIGDTSIAILWNYDAVADSMKFVGRTEEILSVDKLLDVLNEKYASLIKLDLERQDGDTIFVDIENAAHLTQSMGTTGAFGYLAEVTYTLTELPGVKYIHFNFEEGDHASPGLYQRKDFVNKQ